MTTGIFCRMAALTGATIAASSSGARTMPEAPRPTAFSISATWASRSSSRKRPAPGDVDVELGGRLERAGVYALPERVRRALGNHRNRQATRLAAA